jgi:6-phosphogluconolactonase (cycloisomerase 2 family)
MSAKVNSVVEFLFVADEKSNSLQGFRINGDGALAAVMGSPFPIGDTPHKLLASGDSLIMAGSAAILVFQVDKISGALRQTDSVAAGSPQVALDAANNLVFSTSNGETMSYRLMNGMLRPIGSSPQLAQPKSTIAANTSAANTGAAGTITASSSNIAVSSGSRAGGAVIDATGSFAYALNPATGQIDAFRVVTGQRLTQLNPPAYFAGPGAVSIALVAP